MAKKISELPCGAKIKFGAYSVENEGAHKLRWIKTQSGDTIFITERIEDFRAFDAKEYNNPNRDRERYGNNRYSVSNIDSFLNSSEESWYKPRHDYDQAPSYDYIRNNTAYENHQGFLSHFGGWEIDAIMDSEVVVALARCEGDTRCEVITRKVFIPSLTELFGRTVRDVNEGEYWEYFRENYREAYPTREAVQNSNISDTTNVDETWYYMLRSPYAGDGYDVGYVDRGGDCDCTYACEGILGVRPALRINPEILISDEPDEEGYYEVIQKEMENCEVSENDLFALLQS